MKKIIIIVPTAREAAFFRNPVSVCGVGQAECAAHTAKVIVDEKPDLLILAGIAGTYSDRSAIGETVGVVSETVADLGRSLDGQFEELFRKTYPATALPEGYEAVKSNTINCAGAVIGQPVEAAIENMEGAAFFAVCARFGVPAMQIRTISNRVGEKIDPESMTLSTGRLADEIEKIMASLTAEEHFSKNVNSL